MSGSSTIRTVGVSRELLDRAGALVENATRVACTDVELPADMIDRIAAKTSQLARQELHGVVWAAYKEGVDRGRAE